MRQIAGVAEEDVVQVGPGHDRVDLKGRRSRTQSGRALEVAAIAWIGARSPQAKGRVERLWGHGPGPAPQRAAPGRCPHHRWGQRGAGGLPAATRRPLRRAAGQCRVGVAVTACWSTARDGLLLPPSAQRGTRRDVHPRRSQADDRWSLHGELEGTRAGGPGTARWDLLGGTRRRLPARRPGSRAAGRAARLRTSQALRPAARPSLVPLSCGQTTVPKSLTG